MWRTGSTALAWKPEALTHTCVSSTWVAFWSKWSNFPHLATNTETINSKGFMKLLLRGRQRKTNWWVKWLMWKSQSCLGKNTETTSQVFKVFKENTNCTFSECLDRFLFSFPQPQFLLNIFMVLSQTKTIEPEVSQELYFRCTSHKIQL